MLTLAVRRPPLCAEAFVRRDVSILNKLNFERFIFSQPFWFLYFSERARGQCYNLLLFQLRIDFSLCYSLPIVFLYLFV